MKNSKARANCLSPVLKGGWRHIPKLMSGPDLRFYGILLLMLSLAGCVKEEIDPVGKTEITDGVDVELAADAGEVGLVIDVREIFRKGYIASEAKVIFPGHMSFNETLSIDPVTNLALLRIAKKDLTEEQQAAFMEGIVAEIKIYDKDQTVLAEYQEEEQVLDDSSIPLKIEIKLPYIQRPLNLKEGIPYLLQPKDSLGVITSTGSDVYHVADFLLSGSPTQQFYFTRVAGATDTYVVEHLGYNEGTSWYIDNSAGWINLGGNSVKLPSDGPQEFVFEQDEDGWLKIRDASTVGNYLTMVDNNTLEFSRSEPHQLFRLLSDNITWSVVDKGTVYHQTIMPPAQIDFAYEATIRNCTSGILTETVGNTESRTAIQSTGTSESLQLFSSEAVEVGLKVGLEVGGEMYGATGSVEASMNYTFTTEKTTSTENTFSTTTEKTSEVSRSRGLEIPPFTGVEVYDAVRTVKDARVPFTQILRITAAYKKSGAALSGPEIMTQMQFNFVEGLPTEIGEDYVEISLRGVVHIDQMFEVETGAEELPGACD